MVADDALLMAYVDGELSPQQNQELERLIDASPDLALRVSRLMASCLPYEQAFARQNVPPVPESLKLSIAALAAQHSAPAQAKTADTPRAAEKADRGFARLFAFLQPKFAWPALTFVAGAACYALVLQVGAFNGALKPGVDATAPAVAQISPWVQQAAAYQHLYTRETVAYAVQPTDVVTKTLADIREVDGLALRVPDLSAAGLTFQRVQRLRFNNKALVQLVYLPANGAPVALCVMKEPKPDQSIAQQSVAQMNVVTWRQSELGYALIGEPEQGVDLNAVARLVADRSAAQLFADVPAPLWIAAIQE
ncbi:anti-sigma factor [Pseudomonas sp. ChxA]|uniref:anti-sigma factor family protein n=1 Tax=Pseudomonas sp. ChxA TaxID=3035473 RepID=UPI002555525A|nr:anti-sigma factor [Pseudomonas sp. ChxA]MDL2185041.1 anti-sigma factor [Pseudomonas sp. ChxA]